MATSDRKHRKFTLANYLVWGGGILALLLLSGLLYLYGAQIGHGLWRFFRSAWTLFAVFALIGGIGFALHLPRYKAAKKESRSRAYNYSYSAPEYVSWGTIIAGSLLAIVATVGFFTLGSYLAKKPVADQIQVTEEAQPNFAERQPFDVASAVSSRTMGSTSGDATGVIKSVPATNDFSTSIVRRGMFKGYESIQQLSVAPFGSTRNGDVNFCQFSENAELRFGGAAPKNNLTRAIYSQTSPSTKARIDDAIFACEDGTPMIYAPLTKMEGFFFPHEVPGGVAIYNGTTGELKIVDEYEGDLPLYPVSIAEQQRESLTASGTFADYLFRRAGWETTEKDSEDPNGGNRAEFSVSSSDHKTSYYVTPLTPRGASSSIVALGEVESDKQVKNGELNTFTVHRYPDGESRQANSAVAAAITGEILAGYKSNGLQVFEVIPVADGKWVATIGKDQSILYRAEIGADGSIILRDASGAVVGTNAQPVEGEEPPAGADPTGKPIEEMTNEELDALIKEASEELRDRADQAGG